MLYVTFILRFLFCFVFLTGEMGLQMSPPPLTNFLGETLRYKWNKDRMWLFVWVYHLATVTEASYEKVHFGYM